jgi:hypothetical protein
MNFLSIFIAALFVLNFSGSPKPVKIAAPALIVKVKPKVVHSVKEEEEFIPWSPDRRLSWDDFLCEPQRNTDAVASTSTSLGMAYQVKNNQFKYQLTCNFSKVRSWGLIKTPYILGHEQGHFDITELFARKLHKALQEYVMNRATFKKDIDAIYQTVVMQKEAFQMAYDGETDHSRKKGVQAQWLIKIQKLLEDSEAYYDYP